MLGMGMTWGSRVVTWSRKRARWGATLENKDEEHMGDVYGRYGKQKAQRVRGVR